MGDINTLNSKSFNVLIKGHDTIEYCVMIYVLKDKIDGKDAFIFIPISENNIKNRIDILNTPLSIFKNRIFIVENDDTICLKGYFNKDKSIVKIDTILAIGKILYNATKINLTVDFSINSGVEFKKSITFNLIETKIFNELDNNILSMSPQKRKEHIINELKENPNSNNKPSNNKPSNNNPSNNKPSNNKPSNNIVISGNFIR